MRNVFYVLIIVGLLAAGWINRDKLRGMGAKNAGTSEEETLPEPAQPPATPAPASPTTAASTPSPAQGPQANAKPLATPPPIPANPADLVKTYSESLVFVTGEGAGSGFIADFSGKRYLVTNAHVAAGIRNASFKTLQGDSVKGGPGSVAVGHDILTMQIDAKGTPFDVMRDVSNNVSINDEVVVLGNAQGGGVVNTITGRVIGVGPNLVEVDAPFEPGNSGSPIIHLKSKKVIAVATYLTIRKYDPATKRPIQDPVIRRFGYRIDSVKTWQPINWPQFYAQEAEIESIEKLTVDLARVIIELAKTGRVTAGKHTNPAIRTRIDAWIQNKSRQLSPKDRAAADQSFIGFLKSACQADVINARPHMTYDYFSRQLADQEAERTEIAKVFANIIEAVR